MFTSGHNLQCYRAPQHYSWPHIDNQLLVNHRTGGDQAGQLSISIKIREHLFLQYTSWVERDCILQGEVLWKQTRSSTWTSDMGEKRSKTGIKSRPDMQIPSWLNIRKMYCLAGLWNGICIQSVRSSDLQLCTKSPIRIFILSVCQPIFLKTVSLSHS